MPASGAKTMSFEGLSKRGAVTQGTRVLLSTGAGLRMLPGLAENMFRDRASQFHDRLGWDVHVDPRGWETDRYDRADTTYVIAVDAFGRHQASLRFLPTTGSHMLADVFGHLCGGAVPRGDTVWEATRFCLAPRTTQWVVRKLLIGALGFGLAKGVTAATGVFDVRMRRVYRSLGWEPTILGEENGIAAGRWSVSTGALEHLHHTERSRLSRSSINRR